MGLFKIFGRQRSAEYSNTNENFKGLTSEEIKEEDLNKNLSWHSFAGSKADGKRLWFGYKELKSEKGFPFELYNELSYGQNHYASKGKDGMAYYQPEAGNMSRGLPKKVLITSLDVSVPYIKTEAYEQ
jgi:hypothetical protein